jgi:hypothetical protein
MAAGGGGGKLVKKMGGYHQFHAVNAACRSGRSTFRVIGGAASEGEDRLAAQPADCRGLGASLTIVYAPL